MMTPVVTMTLALPEPAPTMLTAHGELRVLGRIPPAEELAELAAGSDVLCIQLRDQVTEDVLIRGAGRLKGVCNYAVGYDNVDVGAANRFGVTVTNTPDVLTDATADCAFGLILAAARRLREGDAQVRAGNWTGWAPDPLLGLHLGGAVLGLIGYGPIAQAVAHRARAFGMGVLYATDSPPARTGDPVRSSGPQRVPLDELLARSDVVSLYVPLTADTRHLIDRTRLGQLKPTAVLVNTSRGAVIDEHALVEALESGHLGAVGLDVYEHEPEVPDGLLTSARTVLSPHLGSATVTTRARMAELVARNAIALLHGKRPPNAVTSSEPGTSR